ncbi:MAG: hypothetical protein NTAFB05_00860 [Nitrobacter sp.]|uniref:hypothetical protein n=1 Tax=Nitrobacter sp. TaxID=29420 RepID=UPI00387DE82E
MSDTNRREKANRIIINKCATIARRISKKDGIAERGLMRTKWFDYRFMSPLTATDEFVRNYVAVYQRKWDTNFSTEEASHKLAIRGGYWRSSQTEFISFWRARQFADELGVPYGLFCNHALEFLLRKGYTRPARPNQLYAEKNKQAIAEHVMEAWREHCFDLEFMTSKLPHYHLKNFRSQPAQHAHQDWVVEQIRARHMRIGAIVKACLEDNVLPAARALFEFGPARFERAREEAANMAQPIAIPTPVDMNELRPSCFGILHAYDGAASACEACMFSGHCKSVTDTLSTHIVGHFGGDDPVLARKRIKTRKRVNDHRARKRAAAEAAKSSIAS